MYFMNLKKKHKQHCSELLSIPHYMLCFCVLLHQVTVMFTCWKQTARASLHLRSSSTWRSHAVVSPSKQCQSTWVKSDSDPRFWRRPTQVDWEEQEQPSSWIPSWRTTLMEHMSYVTSRPKNLQSLCFLRVLLSADMASP